MIRAQAAVFDPSQNTHGPDGMLVHRIDVIHIVLHLRYDAPKVGDKTAEYAGFIHSAQGGFRIFPRRENFQAQAIRFHISAQLAIDQAQISGDQTQGLGVNI